MNKQDTLKKYQDHMQWSYTDKLGTFHLKTKWFVPQTYEKDDKSSFQFDFTEYEEGYTPLGGFQMEFFYYKGQLIYSIDLCNDLDEF